MGRVFPFLERMLYATHDTRYYLYLLLSVISHHGAAGSADGGGTRGKFSSAGASLSGS